MESNQRRVISLLVDNQSGVLARECQLLVQISLHVVDDFLYGILCFGLVDFAKLRYVPEGAEQVP